MVSEPDTGRCANEEVEPRRGVDTGRCANEEAEPRRGWTRGSVPTRTLGPMGGGLGGPTSIGEVNEC